MSAAAPLRGATRPEGGGFAATVFPGSPRRVRGRSSGLKGAAHRAGARQPCGLPWTPETSAAPGGRKSGQARACPRRARRATPRGGGRTRAPRTPGKQIELAFDTQKERKNYTNPLLGSLHTSRGLPEAALAFVAGRGRGGGCRRRCWYGRAGAAGCRDEVRGLPFLVLRTADGLAVDGDHQPAAGLPALVCSQAPRTRSGISGLTRANPRRNVDSSAGPRTAPSPASTSGPASAAHCPIAANDLDPAMTAAIPTASSPAS